MCCVYESPEKDAPSRDNFACESQFAYQGEELALGACVLRAMEVAELVKFL